MQVHIDKYNEREAAKSDRTKKVADVKLDTLPQFLNGRSLRDYQVLSSVPSVSP